MNWERDGRQWPNREFSRFVQLRPHRWHIQEAGERDCMRWTVLLLHGAGASTHSWRDVLPDLAQDFHVVAIDLPGQGFTQLGTRSRCGLQPMARDIAVLLENQGISPHVLVGHSAGAAIAAQLALNLPTPPKAIVSFNGAFGEFRGLAGVLFPIAAKLLSMNPLTGPLFSQLAGSRRATRKLLASTGSGLDDVGVDLYRRLISDASHVDATLSMMSQWELAPLHAQLGKLRTPMLLVVGDRDQSVPPSTSEEISQIIPNSELYAMKALGHLLHEECPEHATAAIRTFANRHKTSDI